MATVSRTHFLARCQLGAGTTEGLPVPPSSRSKRTPAYASPAATQRPASTAIPSPPLTAAQPRPVPIIHSTAYLQQTKQLVTVPVPSVASPSSSNGSSSSGSSALVTKNAAADQRSVDGSTLEDNALLWALKKVDEQLDEVEQHPSQVQQAIFEFSDGPVGRATGKGVQAAAKLTMTATIEAAKVAAPVGKWALKQGMKAAVGLVSYAMEQERQRAKGERRKKD